MKLKICGLKNPENMLKIAKLKPDFIGFIFYMESKRYLKEWFNKDILTQVPKIVNKVGVFVNEKIETVIEKYNTYKLDLVQLHGDEDKMYCSKLFIKGIPVIKAFSISNDFDFKNIKELVPFCKYFLFDTRGESRGGTGLKFNWDKLNEYKFNLPFFLSGGIGSDDIESISKLSFDQLYAIDINSKFEIEPGLKNTEAVQNFYKKLKTLNQPISC